MKITGKNENGNFVAQPKRGNLWTFQVSGRYNSTFTMTDEQVRQLVTDSTKLHKPQNRVEKARTKVKRFVYKMSPQMFYSIALYDLKLRLQLFGLEALPKSFVKKYHNQVFSQVFGTIPVDEIATTTL